MSSPTISVVMTVFNGESFLREAIESVLGQSYREFEFIIIDDGSTDHSCSILDYYRKEDTRVRVYHQENRGVIESLNRGCSLAKGKYIARMDADDVARGDRFIRQVRFLEQHPDVAVVGSAVDLIDPSGRPLGISRNPEHDKDLRCALPRCPFWHPTVLMRTEAFRLVGGYRKVALHAEDHDLWFRMADRFQLANLPDALLKYRVHPDQISLRQCKQQTLSMLALQAASLARSKGNPDPLDSSSEVTPAMLISLGVSESTQKAMIASQYLWRIWNMAGSPEQYLSTSRVTELLHSFDWEGAEPWVLADVQLLKARLYWRQSRFTKSVLAAGRAVMTRPAVLGRPFKSLMFRLRAPSLG